MTPENQAFHVYQGSIYSLLQRSAGTSKFSCFVVAVTSAHSQSGVTYLTKLLVDSLNRDDPGRAIAVDCRNASGISKLDEELGLSTFEDGKEKLVTPSPGLWRSSPNFRRDYIQELRARYSYIALDCPPISESSEVLSLSEVVDGTVSVVEANRTTKSQISYLERTIARSGGRLLGHVLNKRTYPIPEWLHSKLEGMGI
jgi:hypothetical protein